MSEVDLPARLQEYGAGAHVIVERVALTGADLPGLPAFAADTKRSDPRHGWFTARYGQECWEVDAMSPPVLRERIENLIRTEIDWDGWERATHVEAVERESLVSVMRTWNALVQGGS